MHHRPGRRLAVVASAIAAITLGALSAPAAAADAFRTIVVVGGTCVQVKAPPPSGTLTIIQKRGTTTVATDTIPALDGKKACLKTLKAGDRIIIRQGGITIRTVRMPQLTIAMDGTANTVTVSAPKAGAFEGYLVVNDFIAGTFIESGQWGITATEDPRDPARVRFTQDVGGVYDITGGDEASTAWLDPAGNLFRVTTSLPSVMLENTIWKVSGRAKNGSVPTISVRKGTTERGSVTPTASGVDGRWKGTLRKSGQPVPVDPGWRIYHSQVSGAMLTVLDLDFLIDWEGEGSLSQPCWPGGRWVVTWKGQPTQWGTTPPSGLVEVSSITNGGGPIGLREKVEIRCENKKGGAQQFWTMAID